MRGLFLYAFYSGWLYFAAVACFAAVVFFPRLRVLALLAFAMAILTAPPAPVVLALPAIVAMVYPKKWAAALAVAAAVGAIAIEVPYHVRRPDVTKPARVFVIGDSLASGGFGETKTWPTLMNATSLALPSDTAEMALENQQLPAAQTGDVVILEIGGNDMLDGTPARRFEAALDAILARAHPRKVIMLELPLLPGEWRYGAIQRRLAKNHRAVLVPKRILASVLSKDANTSDGIHLTQRGHDALARELAAWLRWN